VRSEQLARLDGDWSVSFRGTPTEPVLLKAGSWHENADTNIKYYSGTATYSRTIRVPANARDDGARVMLNLGEVQDIADVSVNGVQVGVSWTPPYNFDITSALGAGDNKIEIKVTNRAVNSLIGSAQSGTARGFGGYRPNAPLRPSGLIGPVTLVKER
jgi:hypothetical protein